VWSTYFFAVPLGRVGAGALVKDGDDAAEGIALGDPHAELRPPIFPSNLDNSGDRGGLGERDLRAWF